MQSRIYTQPFEADHALAQSFAAYPLALLAAAFGLGILGGLYLVVSVSLPIVTAALSTLVGLTALCTRKMELAKLLVVFAMFLLGLTLAAIDKNNVPANQLKRLLAERAAVPGSPTIGVIAVGDPVEITGVLERDPEVAPERLYLLLRVERLRHRETERELSGIVALLAPVSGKLAEAEFADLDLRYGARIRVMASLERADSFRNPGVSSFTEYLDRKGYDATGFVRSPLLIERLGNTRVFLPLAWLYEWRRRLQSEIDSRFARDTAGVLDAALLGNRYRLSRSTSERFREGGTFHVLVISGLHITFLGGLVFLVARRLTRNKALQFLLSVTVLWAYTLAVGAESSVVRAALMFTVVLLASLVSRRASSLNALGGVGIALLAWRPTDLLDPSFQLTFVSVLAIITLAWPLLQRLAEVGGWRPTRQTPYPPLCAPWLRSFGESLYWSERQSQVELERANYSYRLFKAPMAATLERLHLQRVLRYGFGAVVVSGCVQLALLPFFVIYFHRLSLASFLLNIGVSLLMGAVAASAAAGLLIAQFTPALAAPFIRVADALNWLMVHSVDPFASVGAASIRLPEYTGWAATVYVLYYVPLTILVVSLWRWTPLRLPGSGREALRFFADPLRSKKSKTQSQTAKNAKAPQSRAKVFPCLKGTTRLSLLAQLLAIVVVIVHPWSEGRPAGNLRIDFLDVGQGDSALVTFPDNTTLLVDGGGQPGPFKSRTPGGDTGEDDSGQFENDERSIGESVVSEYLWWRGLDHIDYILATHADADHIDGLNDVARNFAVRAALVGRIPNRDHEYSEFAETLAFERVPIRTIGGGDELKFGNVTVTVLWPAAFTNSDAPSGNNDSVVLSLRYGSRSILLTGDIEAPAEKRILESDALSRESLRADVIKVAHHGSKSSSTQSFIAATEASKAVISVGQTSVFGHPNKAVVERWMSSGTQVLTTGNCGTITVTTNGADLTVGSFVTAEGNGCKAQ
jgi:competence protein ComEC